MFTKDFHAKLIKFTLDITTVITVNISEHFYWLSVTLKDRRILLKYLKLLIRYTLSKYLQKLFFYSIASNEF